MANPIIIKSIFTCLVLAVLLLIALGVGTAFADDSIEWNPVPIQEVTIIEDADFFYADPGMCWGITWNGPQDWTVEVITGEYTVQRVNNFVDYSEIISCEA